MANIESVLGAVERWREGGEDLDLAVFVDFLAWVEDRGQLERLFDGLDGADEVVARCDQFLARTTARKCDEDELEALALRHLEELLALARRRRDAGSETVAAFEALVDVAIAVDDEPSGDLLRLDGTGFGVVPEVVEEWAELSKAHLDVVQIEDFELIAAEISGVELASWRGEQEAVLSAAKDLPGVGAWLLSPVASWEFDFEPAFRLWELGASLLLGADGLEVVTGTVRFEQSVNGYSRVKPHKVEWSAADREWEAANGDGGKAALRILANRDPSVRAPSDHVWQRHELSVENDSRFVPNDLQSPQVPIPRWERFDPRPPNRHQPIVLIKHDGSTGFRRLPCT